MRVSLAALMAVFALAACQPGSIGADKTGAAAAGGYTLEVFAHEGDQIYVVSRQDGKETAARVSDGRSVILAASEAHGLIAQRPLDAPANPDVTVRAPGFALSIADDDSMGRDNARIEFTVGGKSVLIDAAEAGDRRRALVRITGADAAAARNFIEEARDLSEATKADMLRALGLKS
ncbi:MAG: hypothetical protein JNJ73_18205 [Hyphomonadaceae bacterium]|nr:hypothetical protein [Hyphomonadaceae bacterium]